MPYIYSTATCDNVYNVYDTSGANKDLPLKVKSVLVRGGTGIATKNLITPMGVVTNVTQEELEILEKDEVFKQQMKAGFMTISHAETNPEKVAADMVTRDKSAPYLPQDTDDEDKVQPSEDTKSGKKKRK